MKYIIATHGSMASGIKNTIEMLAGKRDDIYTIDAYIENQNFLEELNDLLNSLDDKYIYVFTDIISGSVNQIATKLLNDSRVHLITGINLSILMEIILENKELTDEEIQYVIESARNQLVYMNSLI